MAAAAPSPAVVGLAVNRFLDLCRAHPDGLQQSVMDENLKDLNLEVVTQALSALLGKGHIQRFQQGGSLIYKEANRDDIAKKRRDQSLSIRGGEQGQRIQVHPLSKRDEEIVNSRPSSSKGSSIYTRRNSFGGRDLSGEPPVVSPGSSSKGIFSRINSLDRKKKREESTRLPVFSPSSGAKADIQRERSLDKFSRESSFSESASNDPGLDRGEQWNAAKELPSKGWESASAGMHKTRSTDWYEICLKEEEEEEEQLQALARKNEEESTRGSQNPKVRSFSRTNSWSQRRQESMVFSPTSAKEENKRETNNLEQTWLREGFVRRDAADIAQPNFSTSQRNADSRGRPGLFTPWNALQHSVSNIKPGPHSAPRPKSLLHQFENSSREPRDGLLKHDNLRVSLAGGQQPSGRGRPKINAVGPDEAENWKPERKVFKDHSKDVARPNSLQQESTGRPERRASRDYSKDGVRAETLQEVSTSNWRAERRVSRDYSKDSVRAQNLQESTSNWIPERRASRDYPKDSVRPESLHEPTSNWRPERTASREYPKDGVRPESLQESTSNWRPERTASRDYSKDGVRPESLLEVSTPNWRAERTVSRDYSKNVVRPERLRESTANWRPERRALSDYSKDVVRHESSQEVSTPNRRPERRLSKDYSKDSMRPESLQESIPNWRPERRASRDYSKDSLRHESFLEESIPNWRPERRTSTDNSKDGGRPESLQESTPNWRLERRVSRDKSRDSVRPESLQESIPNWRSERKAGRDYAIDGKISHLSEESMASRSGSVLPKQTKGGEAVFTSLVEDEKKVPEFVTWRVNGSIRPATFYRALHEATAADEESLPHIVGTCPDMCSGKERLQRERLRDLAVFERVSGDMRRTSKELAVKKFCRTVVASELDQSDVRPLPVLWRTQQYLLGLLDDPEFSFDIVHNFLFDRTRAIRQELGMQRILDHQTITIHEEIVRFHILSAHELRELNRKRSKQLDTHLNLQQLSKSLHSLLNLYIRLGADGVTHFENESEFHSYYILLNLGNHGQFQAEPLSLWFPNVPSLVLEGTAVQFARKALRLYRSNNFIGFFRLVREATYLQSCLLELNFDSIRAIALAMLNVAEYKLHPYPLSDLAQQLILEEKEVDELCMYYGLLTGVDNSNQRLCLLAKQGQFATPEKDNRPQYSCPWIDSKRATSYFLEVKGGGTN